MRLAGAILVRMERPQQHNNQGDSDNTIVVGIQTATTVESSRFGTEELGSPTSYGLSAFTPIRDSYDMSYRYSNRRDSRKLVGTPPNDHWARFTPLFSIGVAVQLSFQTPP